MPKYIIGSTWYSGKIAILRTLESSMRKDRQSPSFVGECGWFTLFPGDSRPFFSVILAWHPNPFRAIPVAEITLKRRKPMELPLAVLPQVLSSFTYLRLPLLVAPINRTIPAFIASIFLSFQWFLLLPFF